MVQGKHQIPNNIQIPITNDRNGFVSEFGHLVIGNYLELGIWILGFGSGYAGRGTFCLRFTICPDELPGHLPPKAKSSVLSIRFKV
jgi:hypothetical protein